MAVTTTTRLGITRWTAGTDSFSRQQLDDSHSQLETKTAGFMQGTSRPSAAASNQGFFYFNTSTDVLSYSDGSAWTDITGGDGNFGSPVALAIGDTNSDGTNATAARSNHRHGMPSFGAPAAVSTGLSNGVATTVPRSDHVHNLGAGAINSSTMLGTSVVATGAIQDSAVTGVKLGAGAVSLAKMASLSVGTAQLVDDSVTNTKIGPLAVGTAEIAAGAITDAKVNDVAAGKVTGTLTTTNIPNLSADKITSGTLGTARIPNLDASKITTGTLGTARIPNLDASKITSGELGASRIPNLDASKITTGTISINRLPDEQRINWNSSWSTTGGIYVSQSTPVDNVDGTYRSIWFVF